MADWNIPNGTAQGVTYGATSTLNLTSHANANTKGNYTQIVSSTPFDCGLMCIKHMYCDAAYEYLIDIAIGAEGSETVIISNLHRGMTGTTFFYSYGIFYAPIFIPAGTRLAARSQSTTGNKLCRICVQIFQFNQFFPTMAYCDTYGAATADSGGTSVDPGGTAETKGSYTELISSTLRPHRGIIVGIGNQLNTARVQSDFSCDISIGAEGSEVVLIPDIAFSSYSGHPLYFNWSAFYPVYIPQATRLSARGWSTNNDATDRKFDVIIYCFS